MKFNEREMQERAATQGLSPSRMESPITAAMTVLNTSLQSLESMHIVIRERLAPVMKSGPDIRGANIREDKKLPEASELTICINEFTRRVQMMNESAAWLLERLEV